MASKAADGAAADGVGGGSESNQRRKAIASATASVMV